MDEHDHDPQLHGYELVMPFVTVTSVGGPHDDDSFVAGWECGVVATVLAGAHTDVREIARTVRADNLPQLDLIAMGAGFHMERLACDDGHWDYVRFVRRPDDEPTDA